MTRNQKAVSEKGSASSLVQHDADDDTQPGTSQIPPHEVVNEGENPLPNFVTLARSPNANRRRPAAPEVEDVLTQQTAVLAGIMRRLDEVRPRNAEQGNAMEAPEDPNYNWEMLRVPSTTSFPVPSTGAVQRMASGLLSKLGSLQGRDNHDARFVLQMTSLWPDLDEEDRKFVFQRLNLYSIVANVGWPTAIDACNASAAAPANFYLPPGVVVHQPAQRRNRNYPRQQQQQQQFGQQQQQQQQQPQQRAQPVQRPRRGRGNRNNN